MLPRAYRTGIENISVMFAKPDKRASWEESFNEAKQKLGEWCSRVQYPELIESTIKYLNKAITAG